ncbi:DUF159-domain-containing protein [Coprinellus micaceus]|uniref:DUF159-domain-containing protein n=1 Tax=Coprinellus micaceus TaxID=71717 RepID=A0A4Y7TA71_COPMI|nr:DUF159-domain-containing protein [Coprinellus micaceus]
MCGRFALRPGRGELRALRGNYAHIDDWDGEDDFVPRYNIAPRTQAPVVRRRDPGPSGSGSGSAQDNQGDAPLVMQTMKWGLVPHWSKVEDNTLNTINARAENLAEGGGMWGSIKGKKRCAVPCQGYYEWLTKGKDKLPHFLKRKDGNLLLMAGLYDSATIEGRTIWTFTIVTTDANPEFSWLHDRQPVFLTNKAALDAWLDTSSQTWTPELSKFVLRPYQDQSVPLECYQVPKEVGKIGNESPSFIEPVASRKDGIQAMFAKQKQAQTEPSSSQSKSLAPSSSPPKPSFSPTASQSKVAGAEADSNAPDLHPPSTPPPKVKRPRSASPIDLTADDEATEPEAKKVKVADKNTKAGSSSGSKPKKAPPKSPTKNKSKSSTSSPKKSTAKPSAGGSAKITSFFKKT